MVNAKMNVEAPPPDPEAAQLEIEFIDFEKKADELIQSGRQYFIGLLQNKNARTTIGVILLSFKSMLEDESCAQMMTSVSQQIKDTLIDGEKGSVSVTYINDSVLEVFTNELIAETFQALLTSFQHVIVNPGTPIVLDQIFDVVTELSTFDRAEDLIQAVENGVLVITRKDDPREYVYKGFSNLKSLMTISKREKVMNFMSG
ncbi:hypothetical protein V9T40_006336 [Parthenolecanium corni]|uniref:Uncharacterized protein n=1 Tax=Parthenolecanium corni TaxID=536013 RepID=A0AAN9Y7J5_9HEMI